MNDLESLARILSRLDQLEQNMRNGFQQVGQRFDHVDERFDQVDKRFGQVDERFDQVDQRFGQVDKRFDQADQRFGQVDKRFDQVDQRFGQVDERFNQVDPRFGQVDERFNQVDQNIANVETRIRAEIRIGLRQVNKEAVEIGSQLYEGSVKIQNKVDQYHQEALNTWAAIRSELEKRQDADNDLYEKIRQLQATVDALSAE